MAHWERTSKAGIGDRLADRFLLPAAALVILAIWAFVWHWAVSSRTASLRNAERAIERMNGAVEEDLRRFLSAIDLGIFAIEHWIASHPGADPRFHPELAELIEGFRARNGDAIAFRLVAENGDSFNPLSPSVRVVANLADRDYFAALQRDHDAGRSLFIGKPVMGRSSGHLVLPVARGLLQPSHGILMIVASVDYSVLQKVFDEKITHAHGVINITRTDGLVVIRSPYNDQIIGKSILGAQVFQFLPKSRKGIYQTPSTVTDHVPRLMAYTQMPDHPLVVVVGGGMEDILGPWRRELYFVCLIAGLASLATIVGGLHMRRLLWRLEEMATIDGLTGALNRSAFFDAYEKEIARAERYGSSLTVVLFDIDHFKRINDTYGHAAGDGALRTFAGICRSNLRKVDYFGRLGGEEFGLLFPDTEPAQAEVVAERIATAVRAVTLVPGNSRFTASAGIAQMQPGESAEAGLVRADQALYAAKQAGRDRIMLADGSRQFTQADALHPLPAASPLSSAETPASLRHDS